MTHLRIELNTTGIEEVSHSIIEKLYNLAISGDLDASSNLLGRLHTSATYRSYVDYLTTNYPNLYITSSDYYVNFADPEVRRIFALSNYGDGFGLLLSTAYTITNLNNVTISGTGYQFNNNTTIEHFDELGLFTSVTRLEMSPFYGTTNLKSIDLSNILFINQECFRNSGLTGTINLPSLTETLAYPFANCNSITQFNFSSSLTSPGEGLCADMTGLQTVTGLSHLTSIPSAMCTGCTSLSSIDIDWSKITYIGNTAFLNCNSLILSNLSIPNLATILENAFRYNTALLKVSNLGSITTIKQDSFKNCTNLTEVVLPDTVTTIGNEAFNGCTSLLSINIPSSITTIGSSAFRLCPATLTNVSLPNLTGQSGWYMFGDCTGLLKVSNLGSCTYIANYCFGGCTNLTEVVLPSTCVGLAEGAFNNCSNLEKVNLDSIQYMDLSNGDIFGNCLKLRVLNYQNLLNPTGIALNNVETTHNYRERARGNYFIARGATDIYLPKFDTLMGGRDDTGRNYNGWFCGNGWYRKSTGDTNNPAWNIIYLRDVTTVGKGAFCGCDIINLVINSDTVPNVVDLQWGQTTYNGKLFEGNHTIQHIYVKPELVNDFKNDTYWGEKASIIESIANCPRKTADEVLAGEVGLVDAWM